MNKPTDARVVIALAKFPCRAPAGGEKERDDAAFAGLDIAVTAMPGSSGVRSLLGFNAFRGASERAAMLVVVVRGHVCGAM